MLPSPQSLSDRTKSLVLACESRLQGKMIKQEAEGVVCLTDTDSLWLDADFLKVAPVNASCGQPPTGSSWPMLTREEHTNKKSALTQKRCTMPLLWLLSRSEASSRLGRHESTQLLALEAALSATCLVRPVHLIP